MNTRPRWFGATSVPVRCTEFGGSVVRCTYTEHRSTEHTHPTSVEPQNRTKPAPASKTSRRRH